MGFVVDEGEKGRRGNGRRIRGLLGGEAKTRTREGTQRIHSDHVIPAWLPALYIFFAFNSAELPRHTTTIPPIFNAQHCVEA
jgi:hypothetical protein